MVVGLQGRGKTTLLSVLRNPTAPLPGNVSTVGVEVADWTLSPPAHVLRGIKKNTPLQRVYTYILMNPGRITIFSGFVKFCWH